jgi:hypothetical protein
MKINFFVIFNFQLEENIMLISEKLLIVANQC